MTYEKKHEQIRMWVDSSRDDGNINSLLRQAVNQPEIQRVPPSRERPRQR